MEGLPPPPPPPPCIHCNQVILETEPAVKLLCGHRQHTRCLFSNFVAQQTFTHAICGVCNDFIIPDDLVENDDDDNDTVVPGQQEQPATDIHQKLRDAYWENETFRRGVKEYVALLKQVRKSSVALRTAITLKKAAIHTEIEAIKVQLDALIQPQIAALKTSAEFKQYNQLKMKIYRKLRTLQAIEPFSSHSTLRTALRRQRGLRTWPLYGWRYRTTANDIVRRKFYFRIRI